MPCRVLPEITETTHAAPARQARLLTAVAIAIASGLVAYLAARRQGAVPDFLYPWTGARLFLSGVDPYAAMGGHRGAAPPYDEALFYPFTALVALFPVANIRYEIAGPVFFGLSSGALAYVITHDGLWRVHVFMSASFVAATLLMQFSPLLMTAAFLPSLGFVAPSSRMSGCPFSHTGRPGGRSLGAPRSSP